MCLQCFEEHLTQDKQDITCPFCRHPEGVVPAEASEAEAALYTPDVVFVKRRKLDGNFKPKGRVDVAPRRSQLVTRRLCYLYDYDSGDVSSVGEEVVAEHAALPSSAPLHCDETVELSDDEGVEETKEQEEAPRYLPSEDYGGVEETKDDETHVSETESESEDFLWPCEFGKGNLWVSTDDKECTNFTCRRSACCNRAWCENCWFYSIMRRSTRPGKYVDCIGCGAVVHFNGSLKE